MAGMMMVWMSLKFVVMMLIIFGGILTYLWFYKPGLLIKLLTRLFHYHTGLRLKTTQGRHYNYMYAERGQKIAGRSSMLMIHGFSASKDMMVPVVRKLPTDLHIILLDLPGHGGTNMPNENNEVSVEQFARDVYEFTELVGLTSAPFHLYGASLGGVVAYLYAIEHPTLLDYLTLVNPALETPISTEFMEEVRRGYCRLIPTTIEGMTHMIDSCYYQKSVLLTYTQVLRGSLDLRLPKNPYYHRLFDSLSRDMNDLEKNERLEAEGVNITCPVQLIWGIHDELIHKSGADKIKQYIPSVERVDLLDNCGHSVSNEQPEETAKLLLRFRSELHDKKIN